MSQHQVDDQSAADLSRDVLDSLLEGCQVIGFNYRYLYVNDALATQTRRARRDLIGRTITECFPGIEESSMFKALERCLAERGHDQIENELVYPDGSRRWFELRFIPVPQGVCILSQDITERRHRLSAIIQDSDDAIFSTTLHGIVTSWNPGAERLFGYSAAEMIGRSAAALVPRDRDDEEFAVARRVRSGERVEHYETVRRRKDGEPVEVSIRVTPIRHPNGEVNGFAQIVRDIEAFKQAQRELIRAKEASDAANRELDSFSYSVAHDLRAPLRHIDGYSQALLEDNGDALDELGRRYLGRIRHSAQQMALLIDDLLALSRVTRTELSHEAFDISALARDVVARLERLEPTRRVETVVQNGLSAAGDPRLLTVVLDNLFSNAWKFTSKRNDARIEFGGAAVAGGFEYFVRDNGAGFDMTYVSKLFGVFQRLHSTGSSKALASAWPLSSASCSVTAAAFGLKVKSAPARFSTSPSESSTASSLEPAPSCKPAAGGFRLDSMRRVTAAVCVAPLFLFQPDNLWLNLHQFLYVLGRHEAAMPDRTRRATVGAPADAEKGLAGLTADEQRAWREAVTFYANGLSRQDAVFDDPVIRVGQGLVRAAGASSLSKSGLDQTLAAVLEKAAPIYRKAWWPAHQKANVAWVRDTEAQVEQHGAAITQFITRAYGLPWPEAGYPIQVSAYANWAGAFSTRGNLLIISSLDAGNKGLTGLEITFHEAMHQWDDAVDAALAVQAAPLSMRVPDLLSHALIFYTAGEAVRSISPAHVPYAEANGLWKQKGLGQFKSALEEVWKPYLDGKGTRDQALAEILKRVA